jgi:hypothetical protein
MNRLTRTKPHILLTIHIIAAALAVFLSATAETAYSFKLEIMGVAADDAYYVSPGATVDCLAVIPKIGQNNVNNSFSPIRLVSVRLFILLGICNIIILAFSKSHLAGYIQLYPLNIKNLIYLKLRI